MKMFLMALILTTLTAYAALDMKPGLWRIKMVMNHNGKVINPAAEMQKMLAKLPPEQRKMMEENLKKHNSMINSNGETKVCYSAEMINNPEEMMNQNTQKDSKCTSKILTNTNSHITSSFKCEDGTTGLADWKVKDSTNFTGKVDMKSPKGPAVITYNGTFDNSNCGDVKPITK